MRRPRFRPTYSSVTATLALVVATGGTSYAAAQLQHDSVRGVHIAQDTIRAKDIAGGAVRSSEVQDGSLQARDFRAGQLPTGGAGPQGEPGPQGPQGETGASPVTAFAVVRANGTLVSQRGLKYLESIGPAAGGHVYVVGFTPDVSQCAIQVSVVDTDPSPMYAEVPNGYGTARITTGNWDNSAVAYNVRIFDGGTGAARPFAISAMC
jgi:hypothetical protein